MAGPRGDIVIYQRALRGRWPLPDEAKVRVVAHLLRVLEVGENRDRIRAAQTLVQIDTLNLAHERFLVEAQVALEIREVKDKLDGITGGVPDAGPATGPPGEPGSGPAPPGEVP